MISGKLTSPCPSDRKSQPRRGSPQTSMEPRMPALPSRRTTGKVIRSGSIGGADAGRASRRRRVASASTVGTVARTSVARMARLARIRQTGSSRHPEPAAGQPGNNPTPSKDRSSERWKHARFIEPPFRSVRAIMFHCKSMPAETGALAEKAGFTSGNALSHVTERGPARGSPRDGMPRHVWRRGIAALLLAACLAGCVVGPDYQAPSPLQCRAARRFPLHVHAVQ